jgi:hypothetical protein
MPQAIAWFNVLRKAPCIDSMVFDDWVEGIKPFLQRDRSQLAKFHEAPPGFEVRVKVVAIRLPGRILQEGPSHLLALCKQG